MVFAVSTCTASPCSSLATSARSPSLPHTAEDDAGAALVSARATPANNCGSASKHRKAGFAPLLLRQPRPLLHRREPVSGFLRGLQHTGRRFQSESTLQDIEIRAICPDLDV